MSTLLLEIEPSARAVAVTEDDLVVDLVDGRQIRVPLAWYPRLLNATAAERQNCPLLGDGYAIEWPDLDEHIGIKACWQDVRAVKAGNRWNAGWPRAAIAFKDQPMKPRPAFQGGESG